MSALTITAASVVPQSGASFADHIAGETITAGMPVYIDTTTGKAMKADANASALAATVRGIATHGASNGQPLRVQTDGDIAMGATLTANTVYIAGAGTAGDVNPIADITTGWYGCLLGIAISTSVLRLAIRNTGVAS
jgi:hypothetical protein